MFSEQSGWTVADPRPVGLKKGPPLPCRSKSLVGSGGAIVGSVSRNPSRDTSARGVRRAASVPSAATFSRPASVEDPAQRGGAPGSSFSLRGATPRAASSFSPCAGRACHESLALAAPGLPGRTTGGCVSSCSSGAKLPPAGRATGSTAPGQPGGDDPARRFKERFNVEFSQQQRCSNLAVSRRQRLVAETLQVVQGSWDPSAGLKHVAAEVAAEAEARRKRTEELWQDQATNCESLARPRQVLQPETPKESGPTRSWSEQQAACDQLARPREEPSAVGWDEWGSRPPTPVTRTVEEQQRRCTAMAQPRAPIDLRQDKGEDPPSLAAPWRIILSGRANAPVPNDVVAAREYLLSQLRDQREDEAALDEKKATCAPSRPPRRPPTRTPEEEELLRELRDVVEEVLWAALLAMRSCPKGGPSGGTSSNDGAFARAGAVQGGLEDRVGRLLIDCVGTALRPVARRLLGPGTGLIKRIRSEFPKLAVHLGFRESEDMDPCPAIWSGADEIRARVDDVRACRDELLSLDVTKTLVPCLTHAVAPQ